MKKKIALLLAAVMVVATFGMVLAACGLSDESIQALYTEMSRYHRNDKVNTEENYTLIGHITTITDDGEVDAYVRWTSSSDKVVISSEMNNAGFYTVTIPDRTTLTEDINYTITGTLVDADGKEYKDADGNPYSVTLNRVVPKYTSELDIVDTLTTGNYKILMRDETNDKIWYAKGEIYGGYYLAITEDKTEAAVFTITVDNGSYAIQVNGKYLEAYKVYNSSKDRYYVDLRLVSTPSTSDDLLTLTWDTEHKTFYVDLNGTNYFLGVNYQSGTTTLYREAIGASDARYVDSANNFPIHFVTTTDQPDGSVDQGTKYGIKQATELQVGTDYYLGLYNTQVSTWYFFTGVMGGYNNFYFATSDNKDEAAAVVLESHEDGYYIKVKSSGKYLTLGPRSGDYTKSTLSLEDTASTVWKYDETTKCFTTELTNGENTYKFYLGNYGANVDLSGLARFDSGNYPALLGEIVTASEAKTA